MFKRIAGVLMGVLAAFLLINASQWVSFRLYPPPPVAGQEDPHALAAWIAGLPAGAFLIVLAGYAAGSFAGGAVATRLSGRPDVTPAIVVGAILTAAGLGNLMALPHPAWFAAASSLSYVPFAWLGYRGVLSHTRR